MAAAEGRKAFRVVTRHCVQKLGAMQLLHVQNSGFCCALLLPLLLSSLPPLSLLRSLLFLLSLSNNSTTSGERSFTDCRKSTQR